MPRKSVKKLVERPVRRVGSKPLPENGTRHVFTDSTRDCPIPKLVSQPRPWRCFSATQTSLPRERSTGHTLCPSCRTRGPRTARTHKSLICGGPEPPPRSTQKRCQAKTYPGNALGKCTRWARTINLRFRRPMLYPIELGVLLRDCIVELSRIASEPFDSTPTCDIPSNQ